MHGTENFASGCYGLVCAAPDGTIRWMHLLENGVTYGGVNAFLDRHYGAVAVSPWYFGLIDGAGYTTGTTVNDTVASHPGWSEWTGYAARPSASFGSASGGVSTSATTPVVMTSSGSLRGVFMADNATLGGGTTIHSSAVAAANLPVSAGDTIYIQYTSRLRN